MGKLLDKLILFILSMAFYLQGAEDTYFVVPIIAALFVSAANSYLENEVLKLVSFTAYAVGAVFVPGLLFFIPMMIYDRIFMKWQWAAFFAMVPWVANFERLNTTAGIFILLFTALALLMKQRAVTLERLKKEYISLRDTAKEFSIQLEGKNKELMDKQYYEVHMATLNERNRIAREIHDSVGHLLSSSILQIGALMATARDEGYKEGLNTLKNTLSQGMNSIRNSVHDLHDESVDLYSEVKSLINHFQFCPVFLDFDIPGNPDKKIKYAFLSIVKEGLSNIIKHSDATEVRITLREHPGLYQLIIKDNGTVRGVGRENGIGLRNIEDRVESLKGIANISGEKGFVIFVSVPKEGEYEDSHR